MEPLRMVDLKRQYEAIKTEIDCAIANVINSTAFIQGEDVKLFASELADYLGVKYVIPCGNGTDALQISLMALGLQPGDEVITPSFTYYATVEVVALLKLKPVFVDVDMETFTMQPEALKKAIRPQTKAIIPVHLYGQAANMHEILKIAEQNNIPIIEDNAQAIGGKYTFPDGTQKKTGSMGLIGCTSFFPSKNLGCYGDGGAIFTNDEELFQRLTMIANHGQSERYYHDMIGCNSRLDTIQAAVLRVKLKRLDMYCDARRAAADYYDQAFAGHSNIITPARTDYSHHVFHQYTLRLVGIDRDELKYQLEQEGVPSMIYYPVPCHQQKMFKEMDNAQDWDLPNTDALTPIVLSLPIHTELTEEELHFITTKVLSVIERIS